MHTTLHPKLMAAGALAATLTLGLTGCGSSSSSSSGGGSGSGGGSIASTMTFGGPAEFKTRVDGIPGLKRDYGVTFGGYTVTDTGGPVTVNALKRGQVQAADLFSTDPSIAANGFVSLADPKHNFKAQNIVPIIAKAKNTTAVTGVLESISAKLTTAGLSEMVGKVVNDKDDPSDVAQSWLSDNSLDSRGSSASGVSLTVGSANFPENEILAEIYAEALTDQGAKISTKLNIGSREKYYPALKSGSLDLFPEYSGTILSFIDPKSSVSSPAAVFKALQKALPSNLEALKYAAAQDSDAVVVTKETAAKYGLKTIADLAKSAG